MFMEPPIIRKCELCGEDISNKNKGARFCCRQHKEKLYRHLHRDKYLEHQRNASKRNKDRNNKLRQIKADKEKLLYGFSKNYLRTYAKRHIDDLRAIKKEKCFKCGISQYLGIHHEKYTKDPKDWEFVCYKCHIRIHEPTTLL